MIARTPQPRNFPATVTVVADRIVTLVKGEVVCEATPTELKADPEPRHRVAPPL